MIETSMAFEAFEALEPLEPPDFFAAFKDSPALRGS